MKRILVVTLSLVLGLVTGMIVSGVVGTTERASDAAYAEQPPTATSSPVEIASGTTIEGVDWTLEAFYSGEELCLAHSYPRSTGYSCGLEDLAIAVPDNIEGFQGLLADWTLDCDHALSHAWLYGGVVEDLIGFSVRVGENANSVPVPVNVDIIESADFPVDFYVGAVPGCPETVDLLVETPLGEEIPIFP